MNDTESVPQPSRRTFFIGLAAAVGLILFVSVLAVIILFFSGNKQQATTIDSAVVTKQTIQKNLEDAQTTIDKAKLDQDAAKAALDDGNKRTKLAN